MGLTIGEHGFTELLAVWERRGADGVFCVGFFVSGWDKVIFFVFMDHDMYEACDRENS